MKYSLIPITFCAFLLVTCSVSNYMGDPRLMATTKMDTVRPKADNPKQRVILPPDSFIMRQFERLDSTDRRKWLDSAYRAFDSVRNIKPIYYKII